MSTSMLCRVCVSEQSELLNMLNLYYGSTPATTFIMDILQIKVDSEGSSALVMCSSCNTTLNNFYSFYNMVRDAQHKYNQINDTQIVKKEYDNYNVNSDLDDIDCCSSKKQTKKRKSVKEKMSERKNDNNMIGYDAVDRNSKTRSEIATDIIIEKYRSTEMFMEGKFILNQQQMDEIFNLYFDMRCEYCSEVFSTYKELNNHSMVLHNSPSRIKCCNYYAKNQQMIESHILRRHIKDPSSKELSLKVPCKVCDKMITKTGLRKHLINHLPPDKRTFKCQQCPAGFAKACLLKNHIERCHMAEAVNCNICNKMIRSKACLAAHVRRVHGPSQEFLCPECGKSYKNYDNYTAHIKKHNGEEDKVKCPKCDAIIKRCSLRCHLRRHEPDMKKQCPYCPHKAIHGLSEHIKRVHDKLKRFSCTVCPMKFYSELSLKDHTSSRHTGIPEYSCEFCGKTFMNSGNYHVHRKKMHPTQLAEKKLEIAKSKVNENIPVYDPDGSKKKSAQQSMEADLILQHLQKKKKPPCQIDSN